MKKYYSDKNCLNILRLAVIIITFALLCVCAYFLSFIPKLMIFLNILCSRIFYYRYLSADIFQKPLLLRFRRKNY